jgi:hypothetical protein
MMSRTHERRPPILGPVILIGIGVLALLQNFDMLPGNFWQTIWRFWPVILILIGVEIVIGRIAMPWVASFLLSLVIIGATIGGVVYLAAQTPQETPYAEGDVRRIERDLNGATSANVQLEFGAGSLHLSSTSGQILMVGDFRQERGEVQVRLDVSGSNGEATLRLDVPSYQVGPMSPMRGNEWRVQLNDSIPLDLRVDSGASMNDLDLTDLKLSKLHVEAGLSTNTIRLAGSGSYSARISGGLSTTTVYIPEGLAARIRVEGGLSAVNVDQMRFPKSGDWYVSPNYDSAKDKVELTIESGLSTLSVK